MAFEDCIRGPLLTELVHLPYVNNAVYIVCNQQIVSVHQQTKPWRGTLGAEPLRSVYQRCRSLKSQIMKVGSAATHSQSLLGLKHRALILSAPLSVYRCLPSFRTHSMSLPSFPPDAHNEPLGDTVKQFRWPEWPKWLVFRQQLVTCHTLMTCLSHPAEIMIELNWLGEKRMQDTHALWQSS